MSDSNLAPPTRYTTLRVLADGVPLPDAIDARVISTNYYSADSFHVSIALTPDHTELALWTSDRRPTIEVQVSTTQAQAFTRLIEGRADRLTINPIHRIARIEGRDFSAALIDSYTLQHFPNQSASEIVAMLAMRQGLEPRVTASVGMAGRSYGSDFDQILLGGYSRSLSDWDLIVQLAHDQDFDLYVEGRTLFFHPRGERGGPAVPITVSDVSELRLERDLLISDDSTLTVGSWNSLAQQAFSTGAAFGAASQTTLASDMLASTRAPMLLQPNLQSDDVGSIVRRYQRDIRQHQKILELEMPGELRMTARSRVMLSSTGAGFDGKYDVDYIERSVSPFGGFRQRVRARQSADDL